MAAYTAVGMVRDLLRGNWGVDVLAATAIVSTVAVGEYLASLVVVVMLTGGEALEEYASGRAGRELRALLDRAPTLAHRRLAGDAIAAFGYIPAIIGAPGSSSGFDGSRSAV
jgi:cation transport ATPase